MQSHADAPKATEGDKNAERMRFSLDGKFAGMQPSSEGDAACLERDILRQVLDLGSMVMHLL